VNRFTEILSLILLEKAPRRYGDRHSAARIDRFILSEKRRGGMVVEEWAAARRGGMAVVWTRSLNYYYWLFSKSAVATVATVRRHSAAALFKEALYELSVQSSDAGLSVNARTSSYEGDHGT
jgi:hypothetical protein